MENEYIEEEEITNGLQRLLQELPEESIYCGLMEVEEKRNFLETVRSEDGCEIIRRDIID